MAGIRKCRSRRALPDRQRRQPPSYSPAAFMDGFRRLVSITRRSPRMERKEVISMQGDSFRYQGVGLTPDNKIIGHLHGKRCAQPLLFRAFQALGLRPADLRLRTDPGIGRMTLSAGTDHLWPDLRRRPLSGRGASPDGVRGNRFSLNSRVNRRLDMLEKGDSRDKVLDSSARRCPAHCRASRSRSTRSSRPRRRRPISPSRRPS